MEEESSVSEGLSSPHQIGAVEPCLSSIEVIMISISVIVPSFAYSPRCSQQGSST